MTCNRNTAFCTIVHRAVKAAGDVFSKTQPPTTIQEGEEEVGLDPTLDSVAAQLCHERLILAV